MNVKDTRATVWEAKPETTGTGKEIVKGKISTSRKTGEHDGKNTYANSNWWCTFVGNCVPLAKQLGEKSRINITNATITCEPWEKDGKKTYPIKVTIFAFEMLESAQSESGGFTPVDVSEDMLPF